VQKSKVIFVSAIVSVFFALTVSAFAKGDADVTLSFEKNSFSANEGVTVDLTISNNSRNTVKLLKWYTPADGLEEPVFVVTRDGAEVEYLGAHYKRPQPVEADFIRLKAGQSLTWSVDLAAYYDFSVTGEYLVSFDVAAIKLFQKGAAFDQTENVKSGAAGVYVEGRTAKLPDPVEPSAVTGSTAFSAKCSSTQRPLITAARTDAANYASESYTYLQGGTIGARYTTWFGAYTSGRYATVTDHFLKIKNALDTAAMTFDCGCKKRYYAYVYPTQPYTIYLCSVFWQAPATGTDSKAGTLVHETSHFNVVAGTDDFAYGQSAAKSLAISDPTKAVKNADSHEYFAENTPFQQ
jgi:peptidyl-Lys metalloendopeptidase